MGKRVNYACRSVISPDPYIGTNEIGLPLHFAKTLTFPTPVTSLNIAEMRKLVERGPAKYPGAVWVEFPSGQRVDLSKMKDSSRHAIAARLLSDNGVVKVGRQLRDGDMVLMNRQVSPLLTAVVPSKENAVSYEEISMSCTTLNKLQMLDYDSIHRVEGYLDSCQAGVAICSFGSWS